MKGFRELGSVKITLIKKVNKILKDLSSKGINGSYLLKNKYGVSEVNGFKKVSTKRMTGLISDLKELNNGN